jgi:hypothetical protein
MLTGAALPSGTTANVTRRSPITTRRSSPARPRRERRPRSWTLLLSLRMGQSPYWTSSLATGRSWADELAAASPDDPPRVGRALGYCIRREQQSRARVAPFVHVDTLVEAPQLARIPWRSRSAAVSSPSPAEQTTTSSRACRSTKVRDSAPKARALASPGCGALADGVSRPSRKPRKGRATARVLRDAVVRIAKNDRGAYSRIACPRGRLADAAGPVATATSHGPRVVPGCRRPAMQPWFRHLAGLDQPSLAALRGARCRQAFRSGLIPF